MKKIIFLLVTIIFLYGCQEQKTVLNEQVKGIIVNNPLKDTLFPANFSAPVFSWHDLSIESNKWKIKFIFESGQEKLFISRSQKWTPSKASWELIKKLSNFKPVQYTILGLKNDVLTSKVESGFAISVDPILAPIFYRSVPLPFPTSEEETLKMSWKLGRVSDYTPPVTLMTGKKKCLNCHTASLDGGTFGIEVNTNEADKYSYVASSITDEIKLLNKNVFDWNQEIKPEKSFGANLSAISPEGRYVVSGIRSNLFFVDYPESVGMVSYFEPQNGILGYKEVSGNKINQLKGADDINFVHASPNWSPDGETIAFARTTANLNLFKETNKEKLMRDSWREHDLKRGYKFDIYTIPFNEGKGGEAKPLLGASKNGKSNFFPQYSPDGKWIMFTQTEAGFGIRPDGDLYIIPSQGGVARRLFSNRENAESWHSWSPDSKWVAYVSKSFNSFTQLLLTHIDGQGYDSVPVIVTRFAEDNKAVNMPVFINNNELKKITSDIE